MMDENKYIRIETKPALLKRIQKLLTCAVTITLLCSCSRYEEGDCVRFDFSDAKKAEIENLEKQIADVDGRIEKYKKIANLSEQFRSRLLSSELDRKQLEKSIQNVNEKKTSYDFIFSHEVSSDDPTRLSFVVIDPISDKSVHVESYREGPNPLTATTHSYLNTDGNATYYSGDVDVTKIDCSILTLNHGQKIKMAKR